MAENNGRPIRMGDFDAKRVISERASGRVGNGASRDRFKSSRKRGTWICQDCHLEYCGHRPGRRGPKPSGHGRNKDLHASVSETTKAALDVGSIKAGKIVESVVTASMRSGVSIGKILDDIDNLYDPRPAEVCDAA